MSTAICVQRSYINCQIIKCHIITKKNIKSSSAIMPPSFQNQLLFSEMLTASFRSIYKKQMHRCLRPLAPCTVKTLAGLRFTTQLNSQSIFLMPILASDRAFRRQRSSQLQRKHSLWCIPICHYMRQQRLLAVAEVFRSDEPLQSFDACRQKASCSTYFRSTMGMQPPTGAQRSANSPWNSR